MASALALRHSHHRQASLHRPEKSLGVLDRDHAEDETGNQGGWAPRKVTPIAPKQSALVFNAQEEKF